MNAVESNVIRRLGPGDEDVVRALAEDEPQTALLADDATTSSPRSTATRRSASSSATSSRGGTAGRRSSSSTRSTSTRQHRRQGIGRRLMEELARSASDEAFVLTDAGQRGGERPLRVARRRAGRHGDVGLPSYRPADRRGRGDCSSPGTPTPRSRATGTTRRSRATRCWSGCSATGVDAWIVEADGEPVGYLQSWWEHDRRGAAASTVSSSRRRAAAG